MPGKRPVTRLSAELPRQSLLYSVAIAKMASKFHINQRLSYSVSRCTVRYIGSVEGTNGEWLGVEWDTVDKGKHSGEYQGKKYFECL